MGTEIRDKITPITPAQAAKSMSEGYKRAVGVKPSRKVLGLLLGQWALETGNGKSVHNYNYGNKKATPSDPYYSYFRCSEIINGKEVFFNPPHPACKFTAYRNAEEGAEAFVRLLKGRKHWWDGLHTGTVEGFIKGLTTKPAYFTASPTKYANAMRNRMLAFDKLALQNAGMGTFGQLLLGGAVSYILYVVFSRRNELKRMVKNYAKR